MSFIDQVDAYNNGKLPLPSTQELHEKILAAAKKIKSFTDLNVSPVDAFAYHKVFEMLDEKQERITKKKDNSYDIAAIMIVGQEEEIQRLNAKVQELEKLITDYITPTKK